MDNLKEKFMKMGTDIMCRPKEMVLAKYDDITEHINGLNNEEKLILENLNIHLEKENGSLKTMEEVITDVVNRWQTFNNIEKCAISKALAGGYNMEYLLEYIECEKNNRFI